MPFPVLPVLPWLKARRWDSPGLASGVALLTALSGAFMFCRATWLAWSPPLVGLFGIFNWRLCRCPITVFRTRLARKPNQWFIITYH